MSCENFIGLSDKILGTFKAQKRPSVDRTAFSTSITSYVQVIKKLPVHSKPKVTIISMLYNTYRGIDIISLYKLEGLTKSLFFTHAHTCSVYVNEYGYVVISLHCYIYDSGICQ